jgi:DNA-binding transcriptional regulator YiaG
MLHVPMHEHPLVSIDHMSFAEIDALREELRLPQAQLCQKAEINPTTYMRWRQWAQGLGGSCPQRRSLRAVREVLKAELARNHALCGRSAA